MTEPEPKTEPWTLESLSVNHVGELWTIRCGGACQPEYTITASSLEQAIVELVKAVTESAIHDEALEWSNASGSSSMRASLNQTMHFTARVTSASVTIPMREYSAIAQLELEYANTLLLRLNLSGAHSISTAHAFVGTTAQISITFDTPQPTPEAAIQSRSIILAPHPDTAFGFSDQSIFF